MIQVSNTKQCTEKALTDFLKDWMKSKAIYDSRFWDVTFPGSHNSATYEYTHDRSRGPVGRFIRSFVQCQNKSIFEQLENGVRFLDLRVTKNLVEDTIEPYCAHGGYRTARLTAVYEQIGSFLDQHKYEIIVISVRTDKNGKSPSFRMSIGESDFWINLILGRFIGTRLRSTTKISDLVKSNQRVLYFFEEVERFLPPRHYDSLPSEPHQPENGYSTNDAAEDEGSPSGDGNKSPVRIKQFDSSNDSPLNVASPRFLTSYGSQNSKVLTQGSLDSGDGDGDGDGIQRKPISATSNTELAAWQNAERTHNIPKFDNDQVAGRDVYHSPESFIESEPLHKASDLIQMVSSIGENAYDSTAHEAHINYKVEVVYDIQYPSRNDDGLSAAVSDISPQRSVQEFDPFAYVTQEIDKNVPTSTILSYERIDANRLTFCTPGGVIQLANPSCLNDEQIVKEFEKRVLPTTLIRIDLEDYKRFNRHGLTSDFFVWHNVCTITPGIRYTSSFRTARTLLIKSWNQTCENNIRHVISKFHKWATTHGRVPPRPSYVLRILAGELTPPAPDRFQTGGELLSFWAFHGAAALVSEGRGVKHSAKRCNDEIIKKFLSPETITRLNVITHDFTTRRIILIVVIQQLINAAKAQANLNPKPLGSRRSRIFEETQQPQEPQ